MRKWPIAVCFLLCLLLAFLGFNRNENIVPLLPSFLRDDDKLLHRLGFGLLSFFLYFVWERQFARNTLATLGVMLLLSFASEAIQGVLPISRVFDWWDVLANCEGVGVGTAIALLADYGRKLYLLESSTLDLESQEEEVILLQQVNT